MTAELNIQTQNDRRSGHLLQGFVKWLGCQLLSSSPLSRRERQRAAACVSPILPARIVSEHPWPIGQGLERRDSSVRKFIVGVDGNTALVTVSDIGSFYHRPPSTRTIRLAQLKTLALEPSLKRHAAVLKLRAARRPLPSHGIGNLDAGGTSIGDRLGNTICSTRGAVRVTRNKNRDSAVIFTSPSNLIFHNVFLFSRGLNCPSMVTI